MEVAHITQRRGVELGDIADHRALVGMLLIAVAGDRVEEQAIGIGQHALAKLLLDHLALAVEIGLVQVQIGHALGLGPEHRFQMVGRHGAVVDRHVLGGEGIVAATHVLGHAVELLVGHMPRALEHQVLEEMGQAGASHRIVLAADPVPELHADAGAGHRQGQHGQPVCQLPAREGQRRQL
ncbi:hypothetical protein PEC18_26810 [Paucibacter sp. O1-1]|nr:hypothetical protein [Paucibacter sp. O1-1]MDA3829353.1 hypothetical protein [Paucibacter sp. O1-1]